AALAALLHMPARFGVTRKDAEDRPRPPLLAWVTVLAFVVTLVAIVTGVFLRPMNPRTITNMSWGFINMLLLGGIGGVAVRELIDIQSLRLDESLSLSQVHHYTLFGLWHYLVADNVHVPLYHTILYFWVHWFGDSEWVIRIPSVILGTAAIPLVYVVGKRLIG